MEFTPRCQVITTVKYIELLDRLTESLDQMRLLLCRKLIIPLQQKFQPTHIDLDKSIS